MCAIKGQWVWIKPQKNSEFATPIGCQILRFDRGKALIRNDEGDESWIKPDQVGDFQYLIFFSRILLSKGNLSHSNRI